jgi:AraC-like DNA-binding protein
VGIRRFIGDRAFYRRVFAVMVPVLIQQVITNFVGLLDNLMVGQIGTEPMSGVAIVNQLLFVFALSVFGSLAGPGILTAQFYGAEDDAGVRHTFRAKLYLALGAVLVFGALLILLSSLTGGEKKSGDGSRDRLIAATLRYIDSNISKPLDADSIAGALSVSPSTLTHSFKQEMGISLHKYVTQKRVALAQRLIAGGSIPTKVYADCGYGDYSSFYKAYFKILGHSPSHSGLNDL